jgi:hypothetical protein
MTRILADLPDDDIQWLDARAAEQGKSRASLVREAVATYKAQVCTDGTDWIDAGFGLWARHGMAYDPHEYDRKRRAEWTRTWDDDYEEVRAESPDMSRADILNPRHRSPRERLCVRCQYLDRRARRISACTKRNQPRRQQWSATLDQPYGLDRGLVERR